MQMNQSIQEDGFIPSVSSLENVLELAGAGRRSSNSAIPVFRETSETPIEFLGWTIVQQGQSVSRMNSSPIFPCGEGVNFKDHD